MFSKVVLLVCVCVASSAAEQHLRSQPGVDEEISFNHPPLETVLPISTVKVTCLDGGAVEVFLKTANKARSIIAFGNGETGCTSPQFVYPLSGTGEQNGKFATTTANTCGRSLADNKYTWTVLVTEKIQTNAVSGISREWKSTTKVSCALAAGDLEPVPAPDSPPVLDEGTADFNQEIDFTITKTPLLVNRKWEFVLKPTSAGALAELSYKIKTCTVRAIEDEDAGVPADVKADIIANGCIEEPYYNTVDASDSPTSQKIAVYPIHFDLYPTAQVELICTVELCKDGTGGTKCGAIPACGAAIVRSENSVAEPLTGPIAAVSTRRATRARTAQRPKRSLAKIYTTSAIAV